MARQSRKMAKLNENDSALSFAAAVTAMSIGTGKRLMRNFQYYRQSSDAVVTRPECLEILKQIRMNLFGLQNLYLNSSDEKQHHTSSSFKVMLAKQVQDGFEDLHRKVLFYDADYISEFIPLIDRNRSFWKDSTEPEFYDENLPRKIDRQLVSDFPVLKKNIMALPTHST